MKTKDKNKQPLKNQESNIEPVGIFSIALELSNSTITPTIVATLPIECLLFLKENTLGCACLNTNYCSYILFERQSIDHTDPVSFLINKIHSSVCLLQCELLDHLEDLEKKDKLNAFFNNSPAIFWNYYTQIGERWGNWGISVLFNKEAKQQEGLTFGQEEIIKKIHNAPIGKCFDNTIKALFKNPNIFLTEKIYEEGLKLFNS